MWKSAPEWLTRQKFWPVVKAHPRAAVATASGVVATLTAASVAGVVYLNQPDAPVQAQPPRDPRITVTGPLEAVPELGSTPAERLAGEWNLHRRNDQGEPEAAPSGVLAARSEFAGPNRHRATFCVGGERKQQITLTFTHWLEAVPDPAATDPFAAVNPNPPEPPPSHVQKQVDVMVGPDPLCYSIQYWGPPLERVAAAVTEPATTVKVGDDVLDREFPAIVYEHDRGARQASGPVVNLPGNRLVPALRSRAEQRQPSPAPSRQRP